jgi:hypothetical protein
MTSAVRRGLAPQNTCLQARPIDAGLGECVAAQEEAGVRLEVAELVERLLLDKAAMLAAYFGVDVDPQGCLRSLPQLIEGYTPDLSHLPRFVLQLAREVDWEAEELCFKGVAQVSAGGFAWEAPEVGDRSQAMWRDPVVPSPLSRLLPQGEPGV